MVHIHTHFPEKPLSGAILHCKVWGNIRFSSIPRFCRNHTHTYTLPLSERRKNPCFIAHSHSFGSSRVVHASLLPCICRIPFYHVVMIVNHSGRKRAYMNMLCLYIDAVFVFSHNMRWRLKMEYDEMRGGGWREIVLIWKDLKECR